jgi:hypothetical protein
MVSISHVPRFSPLLCVLLGFRLISSKGDELRGIIDSSPLTLSEGNFLCRETAHDSVTIGVAPVRQSRFPSVMNTLGDRRDLIHALASSP